MAKETLQVLNEFYIYEENVPILLELLGWIMVYASPAFLTWQPGLAPWYVEVMKEVTSLRDAQIVRD